MIIMLLYENKYFVEKIEIRKNMLKDLTVSLNGKLTPITAAMKMDLHELVQHKLDWDDVLPDNIRSLWISHFDMINEIKTLKYRRAVVPADAVNFEINTIDFGDASIQMACAEIYVKFKRVNGQYSCQLILSRSKLIQDGTSQPRT